MSKTAKVIRPNFTKLAEQYRSGEIDPLMIETLKLLDQSNQTRTVISNRCGVSKSCMDNWKRGKVKRPQAATMRFVLRALGYEIKISRSQTPED